MKKVVLYICLLLNFSISYAQNDLGVGYNRPGVILPQVAEIMKYIDYPVDLNIGLVDINIPLYVVQEGDLILPISISYHASGLKVREASGRMGQGWTLNAEPSISRNIQGKPDENGYLETYIRESSTEVQEKIANGVYDVTPDAFYYKLLDKSGKFYFSRNVYTQNSPAEIVVHPYEPIKIISATPSQGFRIVDDKGVNYEFGGGYVKALGVGGHTIQWLSSKVTSAFGKYNINFGYTSVKEKNNLSMNCNPSYIAIEEETRYDIYDSYSFMGCDGIIPPIITEYGKQFGYYRNETCNITKMNPEQEEPKIKDGVHYYEGTKGNCTGQYYCNGGVSYPTMSDDAKISYQQLETITTVAVEVNFFMSPVRAMMMTKML